MHVVIVQIYHTKMEHFSSKHKIANTLKATFTIQTTVTLACSTFALLHVPSQAKITTAKFVDQKLL